ncbi:hypothetical protein IGI04_037755 [Brassica rapa subsp. trilocularis]|uniref:Uncharacterized protein n=1 Tax=Brassica rapa subsp. trilocularis TaxID=1813537 RepID=A0ABQ7LJZ4_BRACM|nr:hypothetical protein IGI04_037755 [Brassica rapa subsp. trilocularis]
MARVDCSNLARSSSPSFPYYRDWNFGVDSNLKPKICLWGFCKVLPFMIRALLCVPQVLYVSRLAHQLDWIRFYRGCSTIRFLAYPRFFFLYKGKLLRPPFLKFSSLFLDHKKKEEEDRKKTWRSQRKDKSDCGSSFVSAHQVHPSLISLAVSIGAKTNMEVLLEVVEEEAKLVVAKPQRQ